MQSTTTKSTEQSIAEMAVIAEAASGTEPESTKKQVSLEEVAKLLQEIVPGVGEKIEQIDQMIQQALSLATTRRFPGNLGMEIRMTTWRNEGWPAITNDLTILMTELLSWQSFIEKEVELRAVRKELADASKQLKAQSKAANAKAVIGESKSPAKAEAPAEPEAPADEAKPATTQRRSRKKSEEPVAA